MNSLYLVDNSSSLGSSVSKSPPSSNDKHLNLNLVQTITNSLDNPASSINSTASLSDESHTAYNNYEALSSLEQDSTRSLFTYPHGNTTTGSMGSPNPNHIEGGGIQFKKMDSLNINAILPDNSIPKSTHCISTTNSNNDNSNPSLKRDPSISINRMLANLSLATNDGTTTNNPADFDNLYSHNNSAQTTPEPNSNGSYNSPTEVISVSPIQSRSRTNSSLTLPDTPPMLITQPSVSVTESTTNNFYGGSVSVSVSHNNNNNNNINSNSNNPNSNNTNNNNKDNNSNFLTSLNSSSNLRQSPLSLSRFPSEYVEDYSSHSLNLDTSLSELSHTNSVSKDNNNSNNNNNNNNNNTNNSNTTLDVSLHLNNRTVSNASRTDSVSSSSESNSIDDSLAEQLASAALPPPITLRLQRQQAYYRQSTSPNPCPPTIAAMRVNLSLPLRQRFQIHT